MKPFVALVLAAAVLTACAGDDDTAPTTTTTETVSTTALATTTPSTTHAPDPPTTVPSTTPDTTSTTTEPPTTTAPAVSTDPSTAPPTTDDLDPIDDLAAAIQRDAQAGEEAFVRVLSNPSADDAEDQLRRYFAGEALEAVLTALEEFRRDNLVGQEHPDVAATVQLTGAPELIDGAERAQVATCRLDSVVVLALLKDTDVRFPIDEEIYRTDALSTFVLIDGVWRLEGGVTVAESTGDETCG